MFVRKATITENRKKKVYLEIFDQPPGRGEKATPVARLGPVELLAGKLDNVVLSMREFCRDKFFSATEISADRILFWGPILVTRHLWDEIGLPKIISAACGRAVAQAAFALTAKRLVNPSCEHGMDNWLEKVFMPGEAGGDSASAPLSPDSSVSGGSPESHWDEVLRKLAAKRRPIEAALFEKIKPLRGDSDEAILYDLNGSFVGAVPPPRQFMGWPAQMPSRSVRLHFGALLQAGWPVSLRFFGGSEPEVAQIRRFLEQSQRRFGFRKLLFVASSGTDEERLRQLQSQGFQYLVGVRRRRDPRAIEVIQQIGRQWVRIDADTKVQEVLLPEESDVALQALAPKELPTERYFVVHSRQEEKEQRAVRSLVVGRALRALEELKRNVEKGKLAKPATIMARAERILAYRKAYRHISWRISSRGDFEFWEDERKSTVQRAYDGISLIKTNDADISPSYAVAAYEGLRRLEDAFASISDTAASRSTPLLLPELEENPAKGEPGNLFAGHLLVSHLAFLLQCRLEKKLHEKKMLMPVAHAIQALKTMSVAELRLAGEKHLVLSQGNRTATKIARALSIRTLLPTEE